MIFPLAELSSMVKTPCACLGKVFSGVDREKVAAVPSSKMPNGGHVASCFRGIISHWILTALGQCTHFTDEETEFQKSNGRFWLGNGGVCLAVPSP